jgi:hypothetical protein
VLRGIDLTKEDKLQKLAATVAERTTGSLTLIHCVSETSGAIVPSSGATRKRSSR